MTIEQFYQYSSPYYYRKFESQEFGIDYQMRTGSLWRHSSPAIQFKKTSSTAYDYQVYWIEHIDDAALNSTIFINFGGYYMCILRAKHERMRVFDDDFWWSLLAGESPSILNFSVQAQVQRRRSLVKVDGLGKVKKIDGQWNLEHSKAQKGSLSTKFDVSHTCNKMRESNNRRINP